MRRENLTTPTGNSAAIVLTEQTSRESIDREKRRSMSIDRLKRRSSINKAGIM